MNKKANTLATMFSNLIIRREKPDLKQPPLWYLGGIAPIMIDGVFTTPEVVGTTIEEVIDKGYTVYVTNRPVILIGGQHMQVTEDGTFTFGQQPYQRPIEYE